MKIEVSRDNLLSNFEVYEHLKLIQSENNWNFTLGGEDGKSQKKKKRTSHLIDLEMITRDLSNYLVKTGSSNTTNVNSVVQLMLGLNQYSLEKIEKLEILNSLPRSIVTLYSIIEECDQRFSGEDCEAILALVQENFPLPDDEQIIDQDEGEELDASNMDIDEEEVQGDYYGEDIVEEEFEQETYTRKTGDEVTIED
ncbi:hypothetical protein CANARDRAFT_27036 [[Candida] arabinofermentans NRRL YB-2248]|uniref:DNA-directed RNA polymerase III subunit RPC9 n=1 Tax=[Candida] arabinofermentans NRRL YB-2248 TaxID=983967 RepID=A0A1E4T4C8_9ASCO|nr:hypothetical protein CANARDRAFT_27036 [[Candida] arabinofermentans NRRL YB-2248]